MPAASPPALKSVAVRVPRPAWRAGGRFLLSDGIERRCQTVDISVTGAALRAPVKARLGEHVICYLEPYGRLEGSVARLLDDGFAVEFRTPPSKRAKLAEQLAQEAANPATPETDTRRHDRLEPIRRRVVLRLADGRHVAAQMINISRSGAALTCPVPLAVGAVLLVGKRPAQVIRVTQRLIGVAFDTAIAPDDFHSEIAL